MNELDAIRARLDAATPGPWFQGREGRRYEDTRDVYTEREVSETSRDIGRIDYPEDAEFIAHAPTDIARLLAAIEAVEALCDRTEKGRPLETDCPEDWMLDPEDARAALSAALTPATDVTRGAGEANEGEVAPVDTGENLGA